MDSVLKFTVEFGLNGFAGEFPVFDDGSTALTVYVLPVGP